MYLKKGDNVIVIAGKDKGKKGKVERLIRAHDGVVIEGVNIKKRHQKARGAGENKVGQVLEIASPIHISNVNLIDPKSGKATRIGMKIKENGTKVRIAKKSGEIV